MRRQLILTYLAVSLFVLIVLEVPFGILLVGRQWERVTVGMERDAVGLAALYEDALHNNAAYSLQPALSYAARTGTRVIVTDARGVSVVDSADSPNRDFSDRPEIVTALAGERASGRRDSATIGEELIYVVVPVASGGVVHGAVRLTLESHVYDNAVRGVWLSLLAMAVVVLLAIAGTGSILAGRIVRPLRTLSRSVTRFSATGETLEAGNLDQAPPEVAELAGAFSEMGDRVNDVVDRHRRFVADASHQLRSPLTAIRLRLDNLVDEVDDPAVLEPVLVEVERLSTLVSQLLHLARSEGSRPELVEIDLLGTVTARCALWQAVAMENGVSLDTHVGSDQVWVSVVDGAVDQILDNLLSNAIAVSRPGTKVGVTVLPTSDWVTLAVVDQGPGLSADDRLRAFGRFWKGRHPTGSSGLGLAIVDELTTKCGGVATLSEARGGGLSASVGFPRRSPGQLG